MLGQGLDSKFHVCHCEATGSMRPIHTAALAAKGRVQVLDTESNYSLATICEMLTVHTETDMDTQTHRVPLWT